MAKKQIKVDAKANVTVEVKTDPAANAQGPDTDKVDSLGNEKDGTPLGPRGLGVPVGIKPEPSQRPMATSTVTDKVDSAGNDIQDEHSYVPGPRGPHALHVKDSYRS